MSVDTEVFHNKHEELTEILYDNPGMLPSRYVFVLTTRCNLRCSFCFQDQKSDRDSMSKEDWIALVGQLPDYARVTITGGEPLVFPDFEEIFRVVAERFDCNIITNGLLLSRQLIDFLLSFPRFKVLSVSVDSIGNTVRNVNPAKWKQLEALLRYFAEQRGRVHSDCLLDIKTTVLDENANDLFAVHKYCVEELACDHHVFQFLKGSSLQHADTMHRFEEIFRITSAPVYSNFESIKEQLEKVRMYNLEIGKKAFMHPKAADLNCREPLAGINYLNEPYHRPEDFLPCKFPFSSVHINSDGGLFPCLAVSMGNVKDKTLPAIIRGDAFGQFRQTMRKNGTVPACNRCGWLKRKVSERGGETDGVL
jgi:MoaA/NifB/PqqE/SkfB family radical SAM enzyme